MAFELEFNDNAQATVDKIKNAVISNNGEFNGNQESGNININTPVGEVVANYKIDGNKITIDIIKKPVFVSEEMIKSEMAKYL